MIRVSAVVPVYRSEKSLPELYARLKATLTKLSKDHEIILVDDRSGDGSWETILKLTRADKRVRGIRLSKNFGQHAATLCGIEHATGEWIVTLDDDLEHKPEYIPEMYRKAKEGFDLVYAVYPQRSHAWWRNAMSGTARYLIKLAVPNFNFEYTSFRMIHHKTARALTKFDAPFPFIDGYLSWVTNYYGTILVDHGTRKYGSSNYNFSKLVTFTVNIFVTFSDIPLKIATWIGLLAFGAGVGLLALVLSLKFLGYIVLGGYASLMAVMAIFGGIQFLILGVFGEYLGRINFKTSHKPIYLMSQKEGFGRRKF